jgi:uncharacterized repeat protein (TIGR03803 family)
MTSTVQNGNWVSGTRWRAASTALALAVVRSWISRIQLPAAKCVALVLAATLISGVVSTQAAQAQTLKTLYTFMGGADGSSPYAGLVRDAKGILYGTTEGGGSSGKGVVFKLNKAGKETVLYSFTGTGGDGARPLAGLIRNAAGNLFGTTAYGGTGSCSGGCGTVFKVDKTGKETVLYAFGGSPDGADPFTAGLVSDARGNLYGVTLDGGASNNYGTVFKLTKGGTESVLYSFTGGPNDAGNPAAGLIRDKAGNLYGVGGGGANFYGSVFKLDRSGKVTLLYSFGGADGGFPEGALIRDSSGDLYGTTDGGGAYFSGTVFKVDTTGTESVLYSFTGGADGGFPGYGSLVRDAAGNSYGTTGLGGGGTCRGGCGTVFKLDKTGTETVLYSFTGGADGANPYAGLIRDKAGNLYGTTSSGGSGYGTVFKLKP